MLMGFFDRLFGKKPAAPAPSELGEDDDIQPLGSADIQGPPEFVRAVEIQRAYWTHNFQEQAELEARGAEHLDWRERLRLHHLICMQRLNAGPERAAATEKCRLTARGLIAPDSPFRPRAAMVWQGQSAQPGADREPDMQGEFLNPSLTHLGCLEVYRVDAAMQPIRLDFVSFGELSGVVFAPPNMIRAAKLFYDDGRGEIVLVPLLYGLTWVIGNEFDRAGRMTRFVTHLDGKDVGTLGASGVGVGQQDFSVRAHDGGCSLFGLGSVAELSFPLDMRDPQFDVKARARGIDPDEVRRNMGGS
jgi:hypothetical protein